MTHLVLSDRDGTLIQDVHYIRSVTQIELIPDVQQSLASLEFLDVDLYVATNQSGIGRGLTTHEDVRTINKAIQSMLDPNSHTLKGFAYCPHIPSDNCNCRKPKSGLYDEILAAIDYIPTSVHVIGDRVSDMDFGQNIQAFNYHVATGKGVLEQPLLAHRPAINFCTDFSDAICRILDLSSGML